MSSERDNRVEELTDKNVSIIERATTADDLKLLLMDAEVTLGKIEAMALQVSDYEHINFHDQCWLKLCMAAFQRAAEIANEGDEELSAHLAQPLENPDDPLWTIHNGLLDNYLWSAFSAGYKYLENEDVRSLPLLASAAFNKRSYKGYEDEVVCLRSLLFFGYDPNAKDKAGATPLHYMASLKHSSGSHPRGVRLLLSFGADPNLQNAMGDTALCYLAGNTVWTNDMTWTALILLKNAADPFIKSNDGASAYSLLVERRGTNAGIDSILDCMEQIRDKG